MQKIIGIRGHRGAGKDSVAFLFAKTLELMSNSEIVDGTLTLDKESYDKEYKRWVDEFVKDKDKALYESEWRYVYLDAFGDAPKAMVLQLLGCDFKYLWDEYWKDHAVVDLKTFDIEEVDELPSDLISPDDLQHYIPGCFNDDRWTGDIKMSLRDFILYFGQTVMQKYFGQDVWVKSTAHNDEKNTDGPFDNGYRIFTDIKAPTELSYVISRGGVIVDVERKGYKKQGGLDLLKNDKRWDYQLSIKGNDLLSIENEIFEIAEYIFCENQK